jgi:hypothetical protein
MKPQQFNGKLTVQAKRLGLVSAIAVALALSAPAQADQALFIVDDVGSVGEVSLVLGKAWLETAQGRVQISAGTPVHATDRILTESNGHVHIRFIDEALLSVRPDSRLEIVQYDYNPEQPNRSAIKLNLEEGVTRSISGQGASAARERFRLNTPIAAIGVRGTDFVVSATSGTVRALVNEGAIVMAPFSSECSIDSFGPCLANGIELTDSALQIAQVDGSSTAPRLLPATVERDPGIQEQIQTAATDTQVDAEEKTAGTGVYLENVTSLRVKADVATVISQKPGPVSPDFTPKDVVGITSLAQNNLMWGRWNDGYGAQERITAAKGVAAAGRDVTVGTGDYILFRNGGGRELLSASLATMGAASFALDSAQAFFHSDAGVAAMAVNGGKLDINFDNRQFATQLNLNHAQTGKVDFVSSGVVSSEGFFYSQVGDYLTGAVSIDGSEAGYFFEKQLQNGGIQGLTLWDKR